MFVSVDIYTALKEIEHKCYRVWLRSLEAYGNTYFSSSFFFNGGKTLCGVRGNPRHTQDTSNMYENFNNK